MNDHIMYGPYELKEGTILKDRYQIRHMVGQGGFGITYEAKDIVLNKRVAVKECFPSGIAIRDRNRTMQVHCSQGSKQDWEETCENFLREARKMAEVDEIPGVVRVRDTFLENNTAYIVMDYIDGLTLKEYLKKYGKMDGKSCVLFFEPLMDSLIQIHACGVIHRDISPDNIKVRENGQLMLLDLGASKKEGNYSASVPVQKPGFSPPEQYSSSGKTGTWSDVYSLCATMFYCITEKEIPHAYDRLLSGNPPIDFSEILVGKYGKKLAAVLEAGLQIDLKMRIKDVKQLRKELLQAIFGIEIEVESQPQKDVGVKTDPKQESEAAGKTQKVNPPIPNKGRSPVPEKKNPSAPPQKNPSAPPQKNPSVPENRNPSVPEKKNPPGSPQKKRRSSPIGFLILATVLLFFGIAIGRYTKKDSVPETTEIESDQPVLTDTPSPTPAPFLTNTSVSKWDIVKFGKYEQDGIDANGKEDIEWKVLEVQEDRALLISINGLEARSYHEQMGEFTWETCGLRQWLNGEFLDRAFSEEEKSYLIETSLPNLDNQAYHTDGGSETVDKVFVLSITEAQKYNISKIRPTNYAMEQGAYVNKDGYSWCWLRSPGYNSFSAANVFSTGILNLYGNYVDCAEGVVRPAFWVSLQFQNQMTE